MQITRKMTHTERDNLKLLLAQNPLSLQNWFISLLAGFIICAFIVSMVSRHLICLDILEQWYLFSILLFIWILFSIVIYKYLRKISEYRQIKEDINIGIVNVNRYKYNEAIVLNSDEENDFVFILKSKDNRAFFFIGENYYRDYKERKFPNTEIEFIDSIHSKYELQCNYLGNYLAPRKKLLLKSNEITDFTKNREECSWEKIEKKYIKSM